MHSFSSNNSMPHQHSNQAVTASTAPTKCSAITSILTQSVKTNLLTAPSIPRLPNLLVLWLLSASGMLRPSSMKVFEVASPGEVSAGSNGVAWSTIAFVPSSMKDRLWT
jgi:hypothetical protein